MGVDIMTAMSGFCAFFQSRKIGGARTDNASLRLQHSYTTGLLFFATTLLSLGLYKDEISCIDSQQEAATKSATQYCWVAGTYTVPGKGGFHPGIAEEDELCCFDDGKWKEGYSGNRACFNASFGGSLKDYKTSDKDFEKVKKAPKCKVTHNYYQWVPYMLMMEGLIFLLPNLLWETFEEGKMESISEGIRVSQDKAADVKKESVVKNIANFLQGQKSDGSQHMKYAVGWVIVQCFCFINVIINWNLLDKFIHGNFSDLGWRWLDSGFESGDEILNSVFPRMTACNWKTHGAAGYVQEKNYLCIMGANIVTQKVFLFLWFWYYLLGAISLVSMLYSLLILFSNRFGIRQYFLMFAERSKEAKISKEDKEVRTYLRNLDRYRFYFVYFLASNVDSHDLHSILKIAATLHPPTYVQSQAKRQVSMRGPEKSDQSDPSEKKSLLSS